jgi:imidazolonepropionase-like amidohydrolase
LHAGTIAAADLLGLKDSIGGAATWDGGNPVTDFKATQSVFFVMKYGKIYRNDRAPVR